MPYSTCSRLPPRNIPPTLTFHLLLQRDIWPQLHRLLPLHENPNTRDFWHQRPTALPSGDSD